MTFGFKFETHAELKQLCQEPGKGEISLASLRSRKPGSPKPSGLGKEWKEVRLERSEKMKP